MANSLAFLLPFQGVTKKLGGVGRAVGVIGGRVDIQEDEPKKFIKEKMI